MANSTTASADLLIVCRCESVRDCYIFILISRLDVPERVTFKLCMTVYKCLHGMGPIYLSEMCRPSSSEAGRRHLRSANRGQLVVTRYRLTTAGRRAFSCAGPSAWNSPPEYLTVDTLTLDYFKRSLKCFLFARY